MSSLPPEAFEVADAIPDPAADDFTSTSKHGRVMGLGPYVQRIIDLNAAKQTATPSHSVEDFWKPLVTTYFTPDASLHIDIKSTNSNKPQALRLPVEALARLWKSHFDSGVNEERMLMENPCEILGIDGSVVVNCPKAVILTTYQHSTVLTNGYLRVAFNRNKKIISWEFSSLNHQELYSSSLLSASPVPPRACSPYGLPASVIRLMYIAEGINKLVDRIDQDIQSRVRDMVNNPSSAENRNSTNNDKPPSSFPERPNAPNSANNNSTASAYRAILSQLDGAQGLPVEQALAGATAAPLSRNAHPPPSTSAPIQSLQSNLAVGLDTPMGQGKNVSTSNFRDAMSSWRSDQAGAAEMFPNLFDEAVKSTFAQGGQDGTRRRDPSQNHADINQQLESTLNDAQVRHRSQSAIEAVAAAASGQDGWGMGSARSRDGMPTRSGNGEVDSSIQMLNSSAGGNLALPPDNDTAAHTTNARQAAPPGLAIFTPQRSEQLEAPNEAQHGRARQRNGSLQDMTTAQPSTAANATMKDFNGLRQFQRLSANSSKREGGNRSQANGVSTSGVDLMPTSRPLNIENASPSVKKSVANETTKASRELTTQTVGNRRPAQRIPSGDGREKRQKPNPQKDNPGQRS